MATCGLEMHDGLDRLWRMIERYKMLAPIAIRVVDNQARCIRATSRPPSSHLWAFGGRNDRGGVPSRRRSRVPSNSKLARCQGKHFENETSPRNRRDI